ncbi:1,6-anhydro-N-acetylmuramyl-L-alanine amidase AmpD [Janthinobacterium sp. 17J80-10]|uniref:1,6-anhydro-N-acetylmuramyl-L-alanine amidase AmpD n=1 Tax=Janthinobacterium sp. 17J80-10 TaxID=2497863 RepID=UPI00100554B6|nr:1,6-anhydro-N-acetylmuramyl-L-alanine amidase AmpD [Janthinobacterium sp. 17J80-10]QAU33519.1 1,6-anhydro-N-acetylmuramyl-L-alanine amidase AmpD [Janthinobacterium sp. 17J80-10]
MNRNEPLALEMDADGWCRQAQHRPSPNFDARPEPTDIDLLVIHNISLPPGQFGGPYIADLFGNCLDCDIHPYFDQLRSLRVSSHFLILRDGGLIQFVSADQRAWHAGVSSFEGRERCNDFSIGIELEGSDFVPFDDRQYHTLAELTVALRRRYALRAVTGHQDIAPGRKTDPGPYFDWTAYCVLVRQHEKATSNSMGLAFPALDVRPA